MSREVALNFCDLHESSSPSSLGGIGSPLRCDPYSPIQPCGHSSYFTGPFQVASFPNSRHLWELSLFPGCFPSLHLQILLCHRGPHPMPQCFHDTTVESISRRLLPHLTTFLSWPLALSPCILIIIQMPSLLLRGKLSDQIIPSHSLERPPGTCYPKDSH